MKPNSSTSLLSRERKNKVEFVCTQQVMKNVSMQASKEGWVYFINLSSKYIFFKTLSVGCFYNMTVKRLSLQPYSRIDLQQLKQTKQVLVD